MTPLALGVYAGPNDKGVAGATAFAAATGSPISRRTEFLADGTRAGLLGGIAVTLDAHAAGPAMTLDLTVPLLTKEDRTAGLTLADVAAGALDDVWHELADQIAAHPRDVVTLRLGHEFNGNWYAWSTCFGTCEDYAAAWRRVWSIIATAPGTERVLFVWCVANGRTSVCPAPELAWPGDRYVDVVGVDFYDYSWAYTQPKPGETQKQLRDRVWGYLTDAATPYTLGWWISWTTQRGKPLAIPEWGPGIKTDGKAGGDNADFVHRVLTGVQTSGVAWASYFEAAGNGVTHLISTPDTPLPDAARAFRDRMSAWTGARTSATTSAAWRAA